jgi:hypothetical protein
LPIRSTLALNQEQILRWPQKVTFLLDEAQCFGEDQVAKPTFLAALPDEPALTRRVFHFCDPIQSSHKATFKAHASRCQTRVLISDWISENRVFPLR